MWPCKNLSRWTGRFHVMSISARWFFSQLALIFFSFVCRFFFQLFFLFGVVWFHNRVPLLRDLIYPVLCRCTTYYVTGMYLYIQSAAAAVAAALCRCCCCCSSCCCSSSCAGWQKNVAGSLNLIPSNGFFSSFKHDFFLMYVPLGSTVAFRPRFANTASSVITVMRGAKAGVSPPRRSPLLYFYIKWGINSYGVDGR